MKQIDLTQFRPFHILAAETARSTWWRRTHIRRACAATRLRKHPRCLRRGLPGRPAGPARRASPAPRPRGPRPPGPPRRGGRGRPHRRRRGRHHPDSLRRAAARRCDALGLGPARPGDLAVGIVFLPLDRSRRRRGPARPWRRRLAAHGLAVAGWRDGARPRRVLGAKARALRPQIAQVVVARPGGDDRGRVRAAALPRAPGHRRPRGRRGPRGPLRRVPQPPHARLQGARARRRTSPTSTPTSGTRTSRPRSWSSTSGSAPTRCPRGR